jgi:preprotein translocase subunit SecE
MKTLINYIKDTKGEMKHVSWPSRHQTIAYTLLVVFISLVLAAFLGLFDFLFTEGVSLTV